MLTLKNVNPQSNQTFISIDDLLLSPHPWVTFTDMNMVVYLYSLFIYILKMYFVCKFNYSKIS